MKLSFLIYLKALAIYLLLTLPSLIIFPIYLLSAWYAIISGCLALASFLLVFYILQVAKTHYLWVTIILGLAIPFAVGVAYRELIASEMPERAFWTMDDYTAFPVLAIIAGWISLYKNNARIKKQFSHPPITQIETISVQS